MAESRELELDCLPESGYMRLEDLAKFVGISKQSLRNNLPPECLVRCQQGVYLVALDKLAQTESTN